MSEIVETYLKNLKNIIAFKSISTDSVYSSESEKVANALKDLFEKGGFESKILKGKTTNPYVFSYLEIDKKFKTVLIYGHYDVMPAKSDDGWVGDPFKVTLLNNRVYGRGVADNKGQFLIHVTSILDLMKSGNLGYNIKFLLEGNEETGNVEIADVIRKNKEMLTCDYIVISDGEMVQNRPTIEAGFRGGVNMTISIKTADSDVHSGLYGGSVPNAVHELSVLISKFYDKNNRVAIPGFYNGVDKPTEFELKNNKSLKFGLSKLKKLTGIRAFKCEKGMDFFTQTGLRPMLTVSGFRGGYIEEGYNNIIPGSAEAKINFRFAASQNPMEIINNFKKFVRQNIPEYAQYTITCTEFWPALKINTDTKIIGEIKKLLENSYKKKVVFSFVGGSIPVIGFFRDILKSQVISIPLANEDCNMHGVNENLRLDFVNKSLDFSRRLFSKRE